MSEVCKADTGHDYLAGKCLHCGHDAFRRPADPRAPSANAPAADMEHPSHQRDPDSVESALEESRSC